MGTPHQIRVTLWGMALSTTAQDELRAELAAIETLRKQFNQKLDARAESIRAVLEPFDFNQTALPFAENTRPTSAPDASKPRGLALPALNIVIRNKFGSGLRPAILEVLREHGPMRAPQIAKILEQTGFKNDSKTPLATRVYNDCWRMIELDVVENDGGLFNLKKTA